LDKVCTGLGISLSQFFAEGTDAIILTEEQKEMLDNWSALNPTQRKIVLDLLKNM
jgi:short-subunit dehydrogenase involved in D-alanine esterification of teichoic acids